MNWHFISLTATYPSTKIWLIRRKFINLLTIFASNIFYKLNWIMFSKSAPLIMPVSVINLQFSATLSAGAGLFWKYLVNWLWTATVQFYHFEYETADSCLKWSAISRRTVSAFIVRAKMRSSPVIAFWSYHPHRDDFSWAGIERVKQRIRALNKDLTISNTN